MLHIICNHRKFYIYRFLLFIIICNVFVIRYDPSPPFPFIAHLPPFCGPISTPVAVIVITPLSFVQGRTWVVFHYLIRLIDEYQITYNGTLTHSFTLSPSVPSAILCSRWKAQVEQMIVTVKHKTDAK
jgi:hypothetical protein